MKEQYLRFLLIFICSVGVHFNMNSQLSKIHYIPPLTAADHNSSHPGAQYIYISTPSVSEIGYTIKPLGTTPNNYITGTVSNSNSQAVSLGSGYGQLFVDSYQTSTIMQKGYIVEAEDVIYVSVRMGSQNAAQGGALVSKGLTAFGNTFRVGSFTNENADTNYLNFVSVMATEDNTTVTFDELPTGLIIMNYSGGFPITATLDEGESYVVATNSDVAPVNKDGLIGTLVQADKPIVVNCGSANGSFHNGGGRDYGIDQIVDLSKVGKEYIFVRGDGQNGWENVLIVAHENNTQISINGGGNAATIDAGEYYLIEGNQYNSNGNMYVKTTNDVFAYQGIGATMNEANQGMFFVPPLSCETRGNVNKIASINNIGSEIFTGGVTIVTKTGANLSINNQSLSNFNSSGPFNVNGNPDYVTYKITQLSNDVSVESDEELYCAYFNYNGVATSGSFYSGFPSAPEINFEAAFQTLGICIPNITLSATNVENFDNIEWYFDNGTGLKPTGINTPILIPDEPGRYQLRGVIDCTGLILESIEVPVSICPDDSDNDGIIDNIDIDNDNDGILNCDESNGNAIVNISSLNAPVVHFMDGSMSTTLLDGSLTNSNSSGAINKFIGSSDGNFESSVNTGNDSENVYRLDFGEPIDIELTAGSGLSTNTDGAYLIARIFPSGKNITLIDPDHQLLVDSNFDGVFEDDISTISGSEIHFKINSTPNGTLPYRFVASEVDGFSIIHRMSNLSTSNSFFGKIGVICYKKDTDSDGISDAYDGDSDNDGIPDILEAAGANYIPLSNIDLDGDGLDDAFNSMSPPIDSDGDGIFDFIDLDSDNDGIFDLEESGSLLDDINSDGIVDNALATIGENGIPDSAESSPDSNIINYVLGDFDGDTLFNFIDPDSDGDLCNDVLEAGFSDDDMDGFLGVFPVQVNELGTVVNASSGYVSPNADYLKTATIEILEQPTNTGICIYSEGTITVNSNASSFLWQVSNDGVNWDIISDFSHFSGMETNTLLITNAQQAFDQLQFRVKLGISGNSCPEFSETAALIVHPLPIVTPVVTIKQCDIDTDGFSIVNLTEANNKISVNSANETFIYFNTLADAQLDENPIPDPTGYVNKTLNLDTIWVRTITAYGCFEISEIEVIVTATFIPLNFQHSIYNCDDYLDTANDDRDGISSFDMSHIPQEVIDLFPPGHPLDIQLYRNENDALSELNPIRNLSNFRNIGYPGVQDIYIRVDSEINNDCLGLGHYITLYVEALPIANEVSIPRQCDDDQDGIFGFDVSDLENQLLQGQTNISVQYFDSQNNLLPSPLPNPFYSGNQSIRVRLTNNSTSDPDGPCFDETTVDFIVDQLPYAYPVAPLEQCDTDYDGLYAFDTSNIESSLLNGQTGMEVYYYDQQGNPLSSPLPNPFVTDGQSVLVEIINPINTKCKATAVVEFIVNPRPEFSVIDSQILCITEPPTPLLLEVFIDGNPNELYDYTWEDPSGNAFSTESTVTVIKPGTYNVTLIKTNGTGCSHTESIEVIPSEIARIDLSNFDIVDDSDNNIIRIDDSEIGYGIYEYALDNDFSFQDEPEFQHVEPGIHTIHINDKNGCGITSIDISVIGYPKFFTPNFDGHNDTWKVLGVDENFYPDAKIYIFDRYGKFITQIKPHSEGWDGTRNNELLPGTDYWFHAEFTDLKGQLRIKKGHFSMIRK